MLLNLLPLNYWLEYLDLVFFFKCKTGLYAIDLCKYTLHLLPVLQGVAPLV